jgi:hypothetical protein
LFDCWCVKVTIIFTTAGISTIACEMTFVMVIELTIAFVGNSLDNSLVHVTFTLWAKVHEIVTS